MDAQYVCEQSDAGPPVIHSFDGISSSHLICNLPSPFSFLHRFLPQLTYLPYRRPKFSLFEHNVFVVSTSGPLTKHLLTTTLPSHFKYGSPIFEAVGLSRDLHRLRRCKQRSRCQPSRRKCRYNDPRLRLFVGGLLCHARFCSWSHSLGLDDPTGQACFSLHRYCDSVSSDFVLHHCSVPRQYCCLLRRRFILTPALRYLFFSSTGSRPALPTSPWLRISVPPR